MVFVDERHAAAFREFRAKLHSPTHEFWLPVIYITSTSESLQLKMSPYIRFDERSFYGHDMLDAVEFSKEESLLVTLAIHLFNNTKKFDVSQLSLLPKDLVLVALSAIALRYQVADL